MSSSVLQFPANPEVAALRASAKKRLNRIARHRQLPANAREIVEALIDCLSAPTGRRWNLCVFRDESDNDPEGFVFRGCRNDGDFEEHIWGIRR